MKEIHDDKFKFVPQLCIETLRGLLLAPLPDHLQETTGNDVKVGMATTPVAKSEPDGLSGDPSKLPPPVSHLLGDGAGKRLSARGRSILCAINAHPPAGAAGSLTGRERTLRALTDDAYT